MAAKIIGVVCLFALVNTLNAQCLNRVIPGCGPNILPMPVTETIIPNQVVLGPNFGPNYGPPIMEVPYGVETILSNPISMPATTIIQDSTVANNLANALQLLVVSNLLSNTLPSAQEVVVPALGYGAPFDYGVVSPISPILSPLSNGCGCGYGPYNYIY